MSECVRRDACWSKFVCLSCPSHAHVSLRCSQASPLTSANFRLETSCGLRENEPRPFQVSPSSCPSACLSFSPRASESARPLPRLGSSCLHCVSLCSGRLLVFRSLHVPVSPPAPSLAWGRRVFTVCPFVRVVCLSFVLSTCQ